MSDKAQRDHLPPAPGSLFLESARLPRDPVASFDATVSFFVFFSFSEPLRPEAFSNTILIEDKLHIGLAQCRETPPGICVFS